jgi:hypothetical protein
MLPDSEVRKGTVLAELRPVPLLVPIDTLTPAKCAVEIAAHIGGQLATEVIVLHVSTEAPTLDRLAELHAISAPLRDRGISVKLRTMQGPIASRIVEVATERRCEWILMGTNGDAFRNDPGFRHDAEGSAAEGTAAKGSAAKGSAAKGSAANGAGTSNAAEASANASQSIALAVMAIAPMPVVAVRPSLETTPSAPGEASASQDVALVRDGHNPEANLIASLLAQSRGSRPVRGRPQRAANGTVRMVSREGRPVAHDTLVTAFDPRCESGEVCSALLSQERGTVVLVSQGACSCGTATH